MSLDLDTAFRRVCDGFVEPAERTLESNDALWARLVAQGRIVSRHHDGEREPYRVHLVLVEHPDTPAPQVLAMFCMGGGSISVYRCLPEDAQLALQHHSAFNL